jgi:hypothetical protein|tara:strand:- start:1954 stop:2490 length:537 start_codon:yes stop_codon:yes gene_type:complete
MASVNIINVFPNLIATKTLDSKKIKINTNKFKKTFESDLNTTLETGTLLTKDCMNYLNIQLTDLLSHLLKPICKTFVFKMHGLWVNKYKEKDYQGTHVHPSDFSFIIYYNTKKSYTVFNSPVRNLLEMYESKIFDKDYAPKLKQNDIIMFPSYLEHWVKPNSSGETIAGNIKIIDIKK